MSIPRQLYLTGIFLSLAAAIRAQEKIPVKFGKVDRENFKVAATGPDSSAGALTVADYGYSWFDGDGRGSFIVNFKRSCRIMILRREGIEAATVSIPLFVVGTRSERIIELKAVTYNLEGEKVMETKLDEKSIFRDKLSTNVMLEKFSFPAAKEGSIVEYTYTLESPFFSNLRPWAFQGRYPCRWSEYDVDMPHLFQFVVISHGYLPFTINTTNFKSTRFEMGTASPIDDNGVAHRWVIRNVPALKPEPYTTSIENHLARMEFQLASVQNSNGITNQYMSSWEDMSVKLLENKRFGADLYGNNGWMDVELERITQGASDDIEKARKIFAFVRDNFKCTAHDRLESEYPIRTVFQNRSGSEADLNLLLVALLRHEKLAADPVILSTRDHGFADPVYPLISRFNYVIGQLTIDSSQYYLDASEPWLSFAKLPQRCYNGYARVIDKEHPSAISLDADGQTEKKTVIAVLNSDDNGGWTGHVQITPGFDEACSIREKSRSSGQEDYIKAVQAAYSDGISAGNFVLESVQNPDAPLKVSYELRIASDSRVDILYFSPVLAAGYLTNPFKAAERQYPVEMPSAIDETYVLNMSVPQGYAVDDLPKSAKVLFNEDEGFFEYLVAQGDGFIQLQTHLRLDKANFKPEDYATLRDFFGYVVKKQSEQIVFKKKKA